MRRLTWLLAGVTLVVAGAYSVVSLNRWEWNRALYFGLVFLAAEVALGFGLVLRRLDGRLAAQGEPDPQVLARIRSTRPRVNRFEWLDPTSGRLTVFITMLVGGGIVLSGLAWLVDKVAASTTTPIQEQRLARDLGGIRYPRGGLVVDDVTVLAQAVPYCDDPQLRRLLRRAGHGR